MNQERGACVITAPEATLTKQDHVQVINDSLNSEPMTEQSYMRSRNQNELNLPYNQQSSQISNL